LFEHTYEAKQCGICIHLVLRRELCLLSHKFRMLANALPIGTRRWVCLTNKKLTIMHRQSVAVGYIYYGIAFAAL